MRRKLERQEHIRPLGRGPQAFLQVLLDGFTLTKTGGGVLLEVDIDDDLLSVDSSLGKSEFFGVVRRQRGKQRAAFEAKLAEFASDGRLLSYRFDCSGHPMRWANGGVLPIVRIDGEEFFCLFYRDIFPVGWNIANGASDTVEEMLDPGRVVQREFGEELLICDPDQRAVYLFEPEGDIVPPGFQGPALEAYVEKAVGIPLDEFEKLPLPTRWLAGPDRVTASMGDRTHTSGGYFLSVTPEDNAIEVDRFALVNLRGKPVLFDGEYRDGRIFNRVVGLFSVARVKRALRGREFRPDRMYFSLESRAPADLTDCIEGYLSDLGPERTARYAQQCKGLDHPMDLCPITRAIINRYFEWVEAGPPAVSLPDEARQAQVFISFRQEAVQIARALHEHLAHEGYRVFCSAQSLQRMGASDYCKVIDAALESATWMVVVGTRPGHFTSDWVAFEWRSFMNEIHSGRKPEGHVFPFVAGLKADHLPYALRQREIIFYNAASPEASFRELSDFLGGPAAGQGQE